MKGILQNISKQLYINIDDNYIDRIPFLNGYIEIFSNTFYKRTTPTKTCFDRAYTRIYY
jgi:hypothetical protein